jgi:glycosyltransferase involved in cell wall biosynthesis
MKNRPLLSIVLPCHNGEKYLVESISSCLNQTYSNIELILIDDCSTDNSYNIMKNFEKGDKRVKVIKNKTNLKLPASLNAGFLKAKGEYFSWTSDDNLYLPFALESLYNELVFKDADAIYSSIYQFEEKNSVFLYGEDHPLEPERMIFQSTAGACFLYKRCIHFTLNGYDTNKYLIEDYDFWLRMYLKGFKIITLDEPLYLYRMHPTSLSSTRKDEIKKTMYARVLENFNSLDKFPGKYHKYFWYFLIKNKRIINVINDNNIERFFLNNAFSITKSCFFIFFLINPIRKLVKCFVKKSSTKINNLDELADSLINNYKNK